MHNLFLICPDCYIEQSIRAKYGNNSFFLTALGSVFGIETFEYVEEVSQFISNEEVSSIFLVNDYKCSFIQNALFHKNDFNTKSEQVLKLLLKSNREDITSMKSVDDKAIRLAKLNIYRQAFEIMEVAFIGNRVQDGLIKVIGLVYDRDKDKFDEFRIKK
ncbi:carbonic anhydrase [Allomuricauda sp. F6463D]|uniref:carbonic anhydrase n=1 Tax=Allomuricauda sp. F6463D TaxID=2926409 RepID=UPI001FF1032E|nr:carbonic anhydrase [Muricauda sp. F6463D]MCK0159075.1 hypothetical protein [Muricauda sp. F6463D]